jgi:hypothetical protein
MVWNTRADGTKTFGFSFQMSTMTEQWGESILLSTNSQPFFPRRLTSKSWWVVLFTGFGFLAYSNASLTSAGGQMLTDSNYGVHFSNFVDVFATEILKS